MPIYEFVCKDCKENFEKMTLSMKEENFSCPSCLSENVEKQFSTFSAHGATESFSMPSGGGCPGAMGGGCPSGGCQMPQ